MQRRTLLKLGIGSAIVLAAAAGAVALLQPGLVNGKLSDPARLVLRRVAQAILAGSLPADAAAQEASLLALLERADNFIAGTPQAVQAELSQLFALLPLCRAVPPWWVGAQTIARVRLEPLAVCRR